MFTIEGILRGRLRSTKVYTCLCEDFFAGGVAVSFDLFSKLFHLSEGYLSNFSFRSTPYYSIDGERVSKELFTIVREVTRDLTRREEAVFRAEGRIHIPHLDRPSTREELRGSWNLPYGTGLPPRPSAARCLGQWYLTTPQRNVIARLRADDPDARREVLSWFAPLQHWLRSSYADLETSGSDLELASRVAILQAVTSYPERLLHHPDPRIPLCSWIDRRAEMCFRRVLHIGPWRDQYARERLDVITRRIRRLDGRPSCGHNEAMEPSPTEGQNQISPRAPSPQTSPLPKSGCTAQSTYKDMPLDRLLAAAKEGIHPARTEVCVRFLPLARKLASRYSHLGILPDLEQEAEIALMQSIDEYDPTKGTFAWLAERRIRDALRKTAKQVPQHQVEYSEDYDDGEDEPAGPGLEIARLVHAWYEYDTGEWGGGGIWQGAAKDLRVATTETLDAEDRALLGRLYGLPGYQRATQQELATEMGVTQQAISKRSKRAAKLLEGADWGLIHRQNEEEDPLDYW